MRNKRLVDLANEEIDDSQLEVTEFEAKRVVSQSCEAVPIRDARVGGGEIVAYALVNHREET